MAFWGALRALTHLGQGCALLSLCLWLALSLWPGDITDGSEESRLEVTFPTGVKSHPLPLLQAGTERQETDRQTDRPPPSGLGTPSPPHQLLPAANTLLQQPRGSVESKSGSIDPAVRGSSHRHPPPSPPGWQQGGPNWALEPGNAALQSPAGKRARQHPRERLAAPVMSPWLLVSCTLSRKVTGPDNIIYIAV